jgi:translation initiation factor 1A
VGSHAARTRHRRAAPAPRRASAHDRFPPCPRAGKGGKNRRRGKNEGDDKRELIFKEDGQGEERGRGDARSLRQLILSLVHFLLAPLRSPSPHRRPSKHTEYAQVLRMLGNGRLEAHCMDGVKRLCHIRGKMRKKVWVNAGDVVLVGLREYQDEKADVILKYAADEARSLKAYGELPESVRVNDADAAADEEGGAGEDFVDFEDVDDI